MRARLTRTGGLRNFSAPMIPTRTDDGFGLRLAVLYACLFAVIGIYVPFFPLWLKARGLDAGAIGIVLATPIVVRIVAVPLINRAVDRTGDLRRGLIAAPLASIAAYVVLGLWHEFISILLAVALASLVSGPISSLADAYALNGLIARRRAYGPVRLWGSIAFIAANFATGLILTVIAADHLSWLIAAAFAALAIAALAPPLIVPSEPKPAPTHLWRSHKFLAIAAAASLIQSSHALYDSFSAVGWTAKGISSTTVGLLWGIGVTAEIVLFALSGRLAINPAVLLVMGATGATVRWIIMAFEPPMALLVPVQCLHGLSYGATHLGSVQFVARMAGDKNVAAAQGDFATVLAIGSAAAVSISGLLFQTLGDRGYGAMAVLAALGGACLVLALSERKKS
jgi:PPP family 3-phenylpropionic acid transporter